MALTYHGSASETGGAIGTEIESGVVNQILPEISLQNQTDGIIISRKFYIANDGLSDVFVASLSMDYFNVFPAIIFESTGDAQVVGDLTGSEVDESPINVIIPASGHKSFWVQITVLPLSSETSDFNTVDILRYAN